MVSTMYINTQLLTTLFSILQQMQSFAAAKDTQK